MKALLVLILSVQVSAEPNEQVAQYALAQCERIEFLSNTVSVPLKDAIKAVDELQDQLDQLTKQLKTTDVQVDEFCDL